MNKIKFSILGLFLTLLFGCDAQKETKSQVESIINAFFTSHPSIYEMELDSALLSQEIIDKIKNIRKLTELDRQKIENSESPTDKPFLLEGSIFTSLSDGYTSFIIQEITIKEDTAEVMIDFEYASEPPVTWTDKVILVNNGGWKIQNIIFSAEFSDPSSLIERLTYDQAVPSTTYLINSNDSTSLSLTFEKEQVSFLFDNEMVVLDKKSPASTYSYANSIYELDWKEENVELKKEGKTVFIASNPAIVPFTEATNYFIQNTFPEAALQLIKIENLEEFSSIFGAATTMVESGKPTIIDFSKHYVIALIDETSTLASEIKVTSISKAENSLILNVANTLKNEGKEQSYSSRPFKILILEKRFQGNLEISLF